VDASAPVVAVDASAPVASRCKEGSVARAIAGSSLDIGEASRSGEWIAVGVARETDGKRIASAVTSRVTADGLGDAQLTDLAPLPPDAPPPVACVGKGPPFALTHVAGPGRSRRILAMTLEGGKASFQWTFGDEANDDFGVDAVYADGGLGFLALAVWDETVANRGVVKTRGFALPTITGVTEPKEQILSPPATDADSPRIVARPGGGYWVAWIAHKADEDAAKDAAPEPEGPGEARSFAWLEVLALDAAGSPLAPPRRLMAAGKHVEAFDMQARADAVDIVVKDDEEPADNAGSRLVLLTLRGDTADEPAKRTLVADGVGHGVPDLLAPWVAFTDLQDKARLVPLLWEGGRQSLEPSLDGARALTALSNGILAGFPADPARALRAVPCGSPSAPPEKQ
jgi:hypothetical protein